MSASKTTAPTPMPAYRPVLEDSSFGAAASASSACVVVAGAEVASSSEVRRIGDSLGVGPGSKVGRQSGPATLSPR